MRQRDMKCEYCGYEHNAKFCPNCGAAAPEQQTPAPPVQWQSPADNYNINGDQRNNGDFRSYQNHNVYNRYYSGIKIRSIASCIILTIITCGLYSILWFGNLNDEANYLSEEPNPTSGGAAFLLSVITCGIYYFYWAYMQGVRLDRARMLRNMPPKNQGLTFLLLLFVPYAGGLISLSLMQNEINNLA